MPRALLALSPCTILVAACSKQDAPTPSPHPSPTPACNKYIASTPRSTPAPGPFTVVQADPKASAPMQLALQA